MLVPVQAAYLPVKGLQQLIKTVSVVKKRLNKKLSMMGILITMVDYRTNYAKDIASMLAVIALLMNLKSRLLFTAGLYMAESCVVPARKQPKSYTDQACEAGTAPK